MKLARSSVVVGVAVVAVLLTGCGRGQTEQLVAQESGAAQGQAAGAGAAGGPDGATGSPDDTTSASPSSDDGTGDDSSALPSTGGTASQSPQSHAASPSSSRTRSETSSPSATSRPRPSTSPTHGGGGGGGNHADRIRVSKCYTNATASTGGELLIKASSSDPNATLIAYSSDGSRLGEVQNGGGSRYGGTVMPYQPKDPGACVIKSSAGGSISVPTTPFKL